MYFSFDIFFSDQLIKFQFIFIISQTSLNANFQCIYYIIPMEIQGATQCLLKQPKLQDLIGDEEFQNNCILPINFFSELKNKVFLKLQTIQEVRDKDLVIILGKSASDQSTLSNVQVGQNYQLCKQGQLRPTSNKSKYIKTGSTQSQTQGSNFQQKLNVYFVDSVGFQKSRVVQNEIILQALNYHTMINAKSVRIVYLIQQGQLQIEKGVIKDIIKHMIGYVNSSKMQKFIQSLLIIITKYSNTQQQFKSCLLALIKSESCNQVIKILEIMLNYYKKGTKRHIRINSQYVSNQPTSLRMQIDRLLTQKLEPINDPKEVFKLNLHQDTIKQIQKQVQNKCQQIKDHIKKGDKDILIGQLSVLNQFFKIVPIPVLVAKISSILKNDIQTYMESQVNLLLKSLQTVYQEQNQQLIQDIIKIYIFIKKMNQFQHIFVGINKIYQKCFTKIITFIKTKFQKVQSSLFLDNLYQNDQKQLIQRQQIMKILQKLSNMRKKLGNYLKSFNELFKQFSLKFYQKVKRISFNICNSIQNDLFNQVVSQLQILHNIKYVLDHIWQMNAQSQQKRIVSMINKSLYLKQQNLRNCNSVKQDVKRLIAQQNFWHKLRQNKKFLALTQNTSSTQAIQNLKKILEQLKKKLKQFIQKNQFSFVDQKLQNLIQFSKHSLNKQFRQSHLELIQFISQKIKHLIKKNLKYCHKFQMGSFDFQNYLKFSILIKESDKFIELTNNSLKQKVNDLKQSIKLTKSKVSDYIKDLGDKAFEEFQRENSKILRFENQQNLYDNYKKYKIRLTNICKSIDSQQFKVVQKKVREFILLQKLNFFQQSKIQQNVFFSDKFQYDINRIFNYRILQKQISKNILQFISKGIQNYLQKFKLILAQKKKFKSQWLNIKKKYSKILQFKARFKCNNKIVIKNDLIDNIQQIFQNNLRDRLQYINQFIINKRFQAPQQQYIQLVHEFKRQLIQYGSIQIQEKLPFINQIKQILNNITSQYYKQISQDNIKKIINEGRIQNLKEIFLNNKKKVSNFIKQKKKELQAKIQQKLQKNIFSLKYENIIQLNKKIKICQQLQELFQLNDIKFILGNAARKFYQSFKTNLLQQRCQKLLKAVQLQQHLDFLKLSQKEQNLKIILENQIKNQINLNQFEIQKIQQIFITFQNHKQNDIIIQKKKQFTSNVKNIIQKKLQKFNHINQKNIKQAKTLYQQLKFLNQNYILNIQLRLVNLREKINLFNQELKEIFSSERLSDLRNDPTSYHLQINNIKNKFQLKYKQIKFDSQNLDWIRNLDQCSLNYKKFIGHVQKSQDFKQIQKKIKIEFQKYHKESMNQLNHSFEVSKKFQDLIKYLKFGLTLLQCYNIENYQYYKNLFFQTINKLNKQFHQVKQKLNISTSQEEIKYFKLKYRWFKFCQSKKQLIQFTSKQIKDQQMIQQLRKLKQFTSYRVQREQLNQFFKKIIENIRKCFLNQNYQALSEWTQFQKFQQNQFSQDQCATKIENSIKQQLQNLQSQCIKSFERKQFQQSGKFFQQLNKIKQRTCLKPKIQQLTDRFQKQIYSKYQNQMSTLLQSFLQFKKEFCQKLIEFIQICDKLSFQQFQTKKVKQWLKKQKVRQYRGQIRKLAIQYLQIAESDQEKKYLLKLLRKYTKQLATPKPITKNTCNPQSYLNLFKTKNKKFKQIQEAYKIYNQQIENYKRQFQKRMNFQSLQQIIGYFQKQAQKHLKQIKSTISIMDINVNLLIKLIATVSFIYAMLKYKDEQGSNCIFITTPSQAIAILLIFSCHMHKNLFQRIFVENKNKNCFVQVPTGEGKSIILGISSLIFALLDKKVFTVCYSKYLSQRDKKDFKNLFQLFKMKQNIFYGTIFQASKCMINKNGDICQITAKKFKNQQFRYDSKKFQLSQENRVLLMDEVDTLLGDNFYQKTYNNCVTIVGQQLYTIIMHIYKLRQTITIEQVRQMAQYKQLKKKYKQCFQKLKFNFIQMIEDSKIFQKREHHFDIQTKKIGYKQLDGITYNIVYGYQTMFHYILEYNNGKINQQRLKQVLGFYITCGTFSYAKLIGQFKVIHGVSGTLNCLNEYENKILEKLKVQQRFQMPSVYSSQDSSNLTILNQLIQTSKEIHHLKIINEIERKNRQDGATLIYFQDKSQLQQLAKSLMAKNIQFKIITQESQKKQELFQKATNKKAVTLMTACFSRGVDFESFFDTVNTYGVLVIQTFWSKYQSEQIQVKGRTARQGLKGQYISILNFQNLKKEFNANIQDFKLKATDQQKRQYLKWLRANWQQQAFKKRQIEMKITQKLHKETMDKVNSLNNISINDQFFHRLKLKTFKMAILVDATGSMGNVIIQVKNEVIDVVRRLFITYQGIEISILFYYGPTTYKKYRQGVGANTNKLHYSGWLDSIDNVKRFVQKVGVSGGQGNQAVQIALYHLLKLNQLYGVQRAMLIGDMPCDQFKVDLVVHRDDQIRLGKGPLSIEFNNVLKSLANCGVQVNTYPIEGMQAIGQFKKIADMTGGTCKKFNPETEKLSSQVQRQIVESMKMRN